MRLRPYQERTTQSVVSHVQRGVRNVLVVAPTGAGKTVIGSEFVRIRRALCPAIAEPRVLFLCHRDELIWQTREKFQEAGVRAIGIVSAKMANPYPTSHVQVASIQTLVARCLGDRRVPLPPADILIPDEAHHYLADQWGAILAFFPNAVTIGLTATPVRSDGKPLGRSAGGLFDEMVVAAQPRELIEDGFLVPYEIVAPDKKLGRGMIAKDPVSMQREYAKGRRTVQFCASKSEAFHNRDRFLAIGVRAATITDGTKSKERKDILAALREGTIEVVTNVNVLTEGFDCPPIEVVQISRTCSSQQLYVQMVGRGSRISPSTNKSKALLIDQRGVCTIFGDPDADRIYDLNDKGMTLALPPSTERDCQSCGGRYPKDPLRPQQPCPFCGKVPEKREAPGDMIVTDDALTYTGSIRRDPERIAHYWLLMRSAERAGEGRGWCARSFKKRWGHYPEQMWWSWYTKIRDKQWSSLPQEARDAALIMAKSQGAQVSLPAVSP